MTCKETHASCLRFDEALNCLVFDNNLGESKPVKIPAPQLSGLLNSSCELVLFANNLALDPIDLTPLLAKVQGSVADLDFRPGPCTLVWTPPDGSESTTFDLSAILDKAQDGATYNQTTCVFSYTNVQGETETFSLASVLNKAQDDLRFDPTDCVLTYTDVMGNPSEVPLTALFNKMTFDATTCVLSVPVPAGIKNFDLSQVLAKITIAYDPATHSLVVNNNGNTTTQVINCSSLELIATGETCVLRFTNAKGQVNDMPLPGSSFTRDVDACTITVGNGKGGGFTFREGIDPAADITFGLTANKDLKLQVKDECMEIVLPDFVTDVSISDDNCELKIFKWCSDPQTIDIFAALGLNKNASGGFDVQIKDQICSFIPATLVVNPDNPNEFIFNNQFGQTTVITVPTVALDMDGATLNGSVLQLSFGGDGNPGALNVDICAVVAQNCNATLVVNPDGSLTHTDNAGVITQVPAPAAPASSTITDLGNGSATIVQTDSTTCDVPTSIPFKCGPEGAPLPYAKGDEYIPLTPEDFRALDVYWPIAFVDSGDGCTPKIPSTKQLTVFGERLESCNPLGEVFRFDPANGWVLTKCASAYCRAYDLALNPTIEDPVPNGTVLTPEVATITIINPYSCPLDMTVMHGIRHAEVITEDGDVSTDRIRLTSERRKSSDGGVTFGPWAEGPTGQHIAHTYMGAVGNNAGVPNNNNALINDFPSEWYEDDVIPPKTTCVWEARIVLDTAIGWDPGTRTSIANPIAQVMAHGGPSLKNS